MSGTYINLIMDIETYKEIYAGGEEVADYIPVSYDVASEPEFTAFFGGNGYIDDTFIGEDVIQKTISEWFAKTLGVDSDNKFTLPMGFLDRYAEKKLNDLRKLIGHMSPQEFRKNGEFKVREELRCTSQLVLPVGELENGYIQTLDEWLNHNAEEEKTYVVVAIYYAKG